MTADQKVLTPETLVMTSVLALVAVKNFKRDKPLLLWIDSGMFGASNVTAAILCSMASTWESMFYLFIIIIYYFLKYLRLNF